MTLWFKHSQGMDSETMREIAEDAGVSWDHQPIVYRSKGIGYANGHESDEVSIKNAAEDLLGYRPRSYDPPEREG